MRRLRFQKPKRTGLRPQKPGRSLRVEPLESRRMLACSVTFPGIDILIHGSSQSDSATIDASIVSVGMFPIAKVDITLTCGGVTSQHSKTGVVGEVRFFGYEGNDGLWNKSSIPTYAEGGDGNDVLVGGSGNDVLRGQAGDDRLYGSLGNDELNGGMHNDVLRGGVGADRLRGWTGNDYLYGESENDILEGDWNDDELNGGSGNDILKGGTGNDELHGGSGIDVLFGGQHHDSLYGDGDSDYLFGESGNDGLYGGHALDFLNGGTGADRFLTDDEAPDTMPDLNLSVDARIHFNDHPIMITPGVGYWNGEWSPSEIKKIDQSLRVMHHVAGDTHLLKKYDGSQTTFHRLGKATASEIPPAWNFDGEIWFTNAAFTNMLDHYVYHEVGHTHDRQSGGFDAISQWIFWPYNWIPAGYNRAEPVDGVSADYIYSESATFAEWYGMTHPDEDFATAFAALFVDASGGVFLPGLGAAAIPQKIAWLYQNVV